MRPWCCLTLLLAGATSTKPRGTAFMTHFNMTFDPSYVHHELTVLKNPSDDTDWVLNMELRARRTLRNVAIQLQIFVTRPGSRWRQRERKFADLKEDFCTTLRRKNLGNIMTTFVIKMFRQVGSAPPGCPVAVGEAYVITNMTMVGWKFPFSEYFRASQETISELKWLTMDSQTGKVVEIASDVFFGGYRTA